MIFIYLCFMKHGRMVIYLLIISYLLNLGHNFIPHQHHHEDHKKSAHSHHHHHHHNLPTEDDEKESNDVLISIFGSMLHHDDDGKFVISSSENEYKSLSSGNAFGLCCSNTVFENFPIKNSRKHPPQNTSHYRLHQKISHGLRAPPHTLV
jgi:hypothetical protein